MTFRTSPITLVLRGLAQLIADANVGFTWRGDGTAYTDDEVGIFIGLEADVDSAQLVLNWVTLEGGLESPRINGYVQATSIGASDDTEAVTDMAGAVYTVLQNLTHYPIAADVEVIQLYLTSSVPMGQDAKLRTAVADHYTADVALLPTSNPPA